MTARFFRRDGGFYVNTQGPDGRLVDFEITYVFGHEPLQQYLIPFPGGRLQALSVAWDVERDRLFHVYPGQSIPPDDWLHWTRAGQNWNGMCAECHSTNLRKGYDPAARTFDTTWSEIDVSCEACHGPGSAHVTWAEMPPMARPEIVAYGLAIPTGALTSVEQVELCAPCHSRRTQLGDYDHTKTGALEDLVSAVLSEGLYHADGQILDEVYVYGSFVQSKMYRNEVRCSDCHDVHSLKLREEGNDLCLQCHRADAYDAFDHHFHKKEHEGKPSDGSLCTKCHMPEQPYMVIDWRADHSLRVPRPDLTVEIGTPNACAQSGCHDDKPAEWAADHFTSWYGKARKWHYGTTLHAGRQRDPEAESSLIRLATDALYPGIVRATALSLLRGYPSEEATRTFSTALADEDPLVRYTAARHVTPSDSRELVELVAPLLFDSADAIRGQAATRLAAVPAEMLKPYQREALDEAISEYKEAMAYSLDFAFAGHNLGNLYENLGQPEEAETYYKLAIEIDELSYAPKMNLAVLYNRGGRNDEAEELLRSVMEDFPDQHDAAYSLGLLLAEMERHDEAAPFLIQASKGVQDNPRVFYNLGLVLQHLGRPTEAAEALLQAHALMPDGPEVVHALAILYVQNQEWKLAEGYARKLVAFMPDNPGAVGMLEQIRERIRE
jgi:predicted CXXCH cytochrome family protein